MCDVHYSLLKCSDVACVNERSRVLPAIHMFIHMCKQPALLPSHRVSPYTLSASRVGGLVSGC